MVHRVFLSSTFSDLSEHRTAVQNAIRQLGASDVSMENFGARDQRPAAECERIIREESDLFVGIYAHRYGFIPEGSEISICEMEYNAASALPRFIYIVDDGHPWLPRSIDRDDAAKKLNAFKRELLNRHICKNFTTADNLAKNVVADIGRHLVEKAIQTVQAAPLPAPAPAPQNAAPMDLPLAQAKDQAVLVGSSVISFVSGVTAEQRRDLINSMLLAQLVAKKRVPDGAEVYDWYRAFFEVLKQIGWIVQALQFATQKAAVGLQTDEAILALATTLLGPGSSSLALVKATLDLLKSMDANSPWMTILNRESQSGQTARFQLAVAEPDDKGGLLVTLMAFALEAHSRLTQFLFFKIHSREDVLKQVAGQISVDAKVLAAVRDQIGEKIAEHVAAYVQILPDFDALR